MRNNIFLKTKMYSSLGIVNLFLVPFYRFQLKSKWFKYSLSVSQPIMGDFFSGVHHGNKNQFVTASTETEDLWGNDKINTVSIVTRHDAHAQ